MENYILMAYIFGGIFIYYSISFIFLKYPQIIHKKKKYKFPLFEQALNSKNILNIAHRGGSRENVENTMEAFEAAIHAGSNMLEMDVRYTKDKKIVVVHDQNLNRLCGVDANFEDFNYLDLPPLKSSIRLDFADNQYKNAHQDSDLKFPLLETVFKKFPGIPMNIEIKDPQDECINDFVKLLVQYDRKDNTVPFIIFIKIWGVKFKKYLPKINAVSPDGIFFFTGESCIKTYITFLFGLLPFLPIRENSIQFPLISPDYINCEIKRHNSMKMKSGIWIMYLVIFLFRSKIVSFCNFLSKPIFEHLQKRGVLCIYWVLNDEHCLNYALKVLSKLKQQNVNGIMTDCPTFLNEYLAIKGRRFSKESY